MLDAALDAGLSGPSRLHDLFIAQEAITPGEARRRGEGLELRWGLAPTPFGQGLFVIAPRGPVRPGLLRRGGRRETPPSPTCTPAGRRPTGSATTTAAEAMAAQAFLGVGEPMPVVLIGPPFHVQVWKALLRIPAGRPPPMARSRAWAGKPGRLPRDRRGDRGQSDQLPDPLPPGHRQGRPADRLPLGPGAQGGDAGDARRWRLARRAA